MKIILIDNYDSFTFNLYHYLSNFSDVDVVRNDKIKSVNTFDLLNYIKSKQKRTKLYFLIGADNLVKFHKWKNWKKIPELAKIVIFPRDNYLVRKSKYIVLKTLKKKDLIYINSKKVNISSSLIRKFW